MFQVYAPIYAIQAGLGAEIGGAMVSVGVGCMWFVPLWGWLGRRFGFSANLRKGESDPRLDESQPNPGPAT